MRKQYKNRTYGIIWSTLGQCYVASWRDYSAAGLTIERALESCHQMIEADCESEDQD